MNTESTIETMAVVTPNCAMANRNHTSSYKTLQKPEMRKKTKYQFTSLRFPGEDPEPNPVGSV